MNMQKIDTSHLKYPHEALDVITSKFTPKEIVHKDGGFVMAVGDWEDEFLPRVAVRWHEPGKIGYPNGFGKPQWMLTPINPKSIKSLGNPFLPNAVTIELLGDTREVVVGGWAFTGNDWHLITYVYGDDGHMVNACGLGKSESYPIRLGEITQVSTGRSLMDIWYQDVMGGDICLWSTPEGRILITTKTPPATLWGKKNPQNVYSGVELTESPMTGECSYGETTDRVFDYMLSEHVLLGRISLDSVKTSVNDSEVVNYSVVKDWALSVLIGLTQVDIDPANTESRSFVDDVTALYPSGDIENHLFPEDIIMGSYYRVITD